MTKDNQTENMKAQREKLRKKVFMDNMNKVFIYVMQIFNNDDDMATGRL